WGAVNQPISEAAFDRLYAKVLGYLKERDELYVFEGFAGADEKYRLPITVVN
ncbi:phosphoenolpyruvate carboxykinase (ATP), partial [Bacillus licheniformis]